jgi:hypothetical protein
LLAWSTFLEKYVVSQPGESFLSFLWNRIINYGAQRPTIAHLRILKSLTPIPLTSTIWWSPVNVSKWRMGFNSAFKGLMQPTLSHPVSPLFHGVDLYSHSSCIANNLNDSPCPSGKLEPAKSQLKRMHSEGGVSTHKK